MAGNGKHKNHRSNSRSGSKKQNTRKQKRISYEMQTIGLPPGALINIPGTENSVIECLRYNPDIYQLSHKLPLLFDNVPQPEAPAFWENTASHPDTAETERAGTQNEYRQSQSGYPYGFAESQSGKQNAQEAFWSTQPLPGKDRYVHWINIDNPSKDVLSSLTDLYGIHPLVLEDVQTPLPRPKFEEYSNHLYLTIQVPAFTNGEPDRQTIALICGTGYLISFLRQDSAILTSVRSRVTNDQGRIRRLGADYLLFCLLDEAVDRSFPIIELMESNIEDLESEVLVSADQYNLERVLATKREITALRHYIWPLTEVIAGLQRTHSTFITEGVRLFLRDIVDHGLHLSDLVNSLREMTSGLLDLYHSSVSGNLNKVMKVLTVISTVFIPLTFISSIYGMNFDYMPELGIPWAYPLVLGIMAGLGIGMFIFFKRKKWL